MPGVTTGRCRLHLGNTPSHKAAAEKAAAIALREEARQACELFNLPMEHREPARVLSDEILRANRAVAWHEREIAMAMEAGDDELRERLYVAWQVERRTAERVAAEVLRLGIQDRVAQAMEDEARRAVAVLEAFVTAMGLDRREPRVLEAGRVALRVLPGAGE